LIIFDKGGSPPTHINTYYHTVTNHLGDSIVSIPSLHFTLHITNGISLSTKMSTTPLPPLPFEILSQILSYLPPSSLRSARLTSRTLAKIGAHHLLSRIYLAPRPATLAAFTSITQHPIFSRTITEIVYDDTLLEAALTHKEAHEAAVIRRALE